MRKCRDGRQMDYEATTPEDFGASLTGLGLNLIVRDVTEEIAFLETVFDMSAHRVSADFAIMRYGDQLVQLHSDGTYHANPLLGLLPESPPRGAGIEVRLYNSDPDEACARALVADAMILQGPANKPHGLREAYVLCPNGYAWVPSRALTKEERL